MPVVVVDCSWYFDLDHSNNAAVVDGYGYLHHCFATDVVETRLEISHPEYDSVTMPIAAVALVIFVEFLHAVAAVPAAAAPFAATVLDVVEATVPDD